MTGPTAPGDSGGPLLLQRNNQWFAADVTTGAQGGVGFTEADVAAVCVNGLNYTCENDFAPVAVIGTPTASAAIVAIPEPSGLMSLAVSALALTRRRSGDA